MKFSIKLTNVLTSGFDRSLQLLGMVANEPFVYFRKLPAGSAIHANPCKRICSYSKGAE
ncbi:protein of unknown function [Nitrospira japonica]|uniref:Uncharacterized protein n=1 Tax=Nitrospira japonica TaxID=1325564 RepID=A0A1W1I3M4_9BACT|nr:protein of unknown function [Nitrospira japonica]